MDVVIVEVACDKNEWREKSCEGMVVKERRDIELQAGGKLKDKYRETRTQHHCGVHTSSTVQKC